VASLSWPLAIVWAASLFVTAVLSAVMTLSAVAIWAMWQI
jgi:hypothetical protein